MNVALPEVALTNTEGQVLPSSEYVTESPSTSTGLATVNVQVFPVLPASGVVAQAKDAGVAGALFCAVIVFDMTAPE